MNKQVKGRPISREVEFAGIKFKSPIGVTAVAFPCGEGVTPEMHAEGILKHAEASAGFICTPGHQFATDETIAKLRKKAVPEESPAFKGNGMRWLRAEAIGGKHGIEGAYYFATPFWLNPEQDKIVAGHYEKVIKLLGEKKPKDVRLIAAFAGYGDFAETYVEAAIRAEQLGADLIELNASCSMPLSTKSTIDYFFSRKYPLRMVGVAVGDHADLVAKITREVVKAVNIPVGWKLSPEMGLTRLVEMVRGIRDAGGTWVSTCNGAMTIMPPDIYNRGKPLWPFCDANPFVAAGGPWLRRDCYKFIAGIAKFVPGIDILAVGGIFTPEHSVEAMMLGAKLVGLCTGVIYRGRRLIRQTNTFLNSFAQEQGYEKIEDIIGLGQKYIKPIEEVDIKAGKTMAQLDSDKCTGCGVCLDLCLAFHSEDGLISIKEENCNGCGCCVMVCPANAIKLVLTE